MRQLKFVQVKDFLGQKFRFAIKNVDASIETHDLVEFMGRKGDPEFVEKAEVTEILTVKLSTEDP
jgi:hypothetical protein